MKKKKDRKGTERKGNDGKGKRKMRSPVGR
jgi:hypothetical protein